MTAALDFIFGARPRDARLRSRAGFTLVDLVLTVVLCGIVLALLAPALRSALAATRRSRCADNLRQLAMAAHAHLAAHRVFPPGCVSATIPGTNGWNRTSVPDWSTDFTWPSQILFYLDEEAAYTLYNFQMPNSDPVNAAARAIPIFTYVCPEDEIQINEPRPGQPGYAECDETCNWQQWSRMRLNYAANYGNTGYAQADMNGVKFLGGFFSNGRSYQASDIADGLGQTVAFGEVLPVHGPRYGGPPGDGLIAEGGQAFEAYLTPNSTAADVVTNVCPRRRMLPVDCVVDMRLANQTIAARSAHAGGVHCALGDCSVRFVDDAIDVRAWRALCSSRDSDETDADETGSTP